jgi:hypothetical protein
MQKVIGTILIISVVLGGCSVFRKAENGGKALTSETGKNIDIVKNNISNKSFYIQKASVTVSENSVTSRFLATIKYKLPDSVLISVKARIGFEAARIFMTKDTLIINDRINRKVRVGNPQVLKKKYGIEPSYIFVILGDFIIEQESLELPVNCRNGFYNDKFLVGDREINYLVDCRKKKIVSASFEGDIKTGDIDLTFSEFISAEDLIMPGIIEVSGTSSSIKAKIEIEKAVNNYQGYIGFKSGGNYEVIRLK